jgi:hypothetical protein
MRWCLAATPQLRRRRRDSHFKPCAFHLARPKGRAFGERIAKTARKLLDALVPSPAAAGAEAA